LAQLSDAGVDLTAIAKLTIGVGNGAQAAQPGDDVNTIYIDHIRLCPLEEAATD
jgi:hypothetical protein